MQQPSSRPPSVSTRLGPSPRPHQVNTQTKLIDTVHGRILCVADIRGHFSSLNDLAREENAKAVIHTGDFGFFEAPSIERIHDRTLRHLVMYSPLIQSAQRNHLLSSDNTPAAIRNTVNISMLSEFPLLLSGQIKLQVPVFTVAGACEDILLLEKLRTGTYDIENLHLIDEATTRCLDIGGIKLRLLGLGGAFVTHKMFDNGEGSATIAGGNGTIWTTALQIGELVDTAQRVYDPTETRLLITHASPGREGSLPDLTISAGLHFRYASSWNEFSVQGDYDGFRNKLRNGKDHFYRVWDSVKSQVDAVIDDHQRVFLDKALSSLTSAWKNCWNWNLCDAAYGSLLLDIRRVVLAQSLRAKPSLPPQTATSVTPIKAQTPAPAEKATPQGPDTLPPSRAVPSTSEPASGKETPPIVKVNGSDSAEDKGERDREKHKPKRKDRRDHDRDRAGKDAARDGDAEGSGGEKKDDAAATAPPKPEVDTTGSPAPGSDTGPQSPRTESTGARTPTTRKQGRHPWTLFVRLQSVTNETDLREFFKEAKDGITRVHFPASYNGRERKIAYVEFTDEDAMNAGLEKHAEKLNDGVPEVMRSSERESRDYGYRGGRGRGGHHHRGGYAARGLHSAGLTRGGGPKTNGDA
ncbi:hypothetical protein BGY98DRAFT_1120327 [Russula aff. rugulosa BPL654]|nr:hypothetical protein BGY98DRAFT_1120327 [Russula aff. rugulosa BPL654]